MKKRAISLRRTNELLRPFKLEYYRFILLALLERGDVEFITYKDLCWKKEDDHTRGYPNEWQEWQSQIQNCKISNKRCYVLIQHDVDDGPVETMEMLSLEAEYGIVSTTMVFDEWRGVGETGDLRPYPIDYTRLQAFEALGFHFGYHCNAYHNLGMKEEGLYEKFDKELDSLRKKLSINYFSPHGGTVDSQGKGNAHFDYPDNVKPSVIWVHNRCSPRFKSTYSDGGLIDRLEKGDERLDIFSWLKRLQPGCRYRILLHPQYYSDIDYTPLSGVALDWYNQRRV